jgi:phosphoglycerate dehydrogenase-like enzyme
MQGGGVVNILFAAPENAWGGFLGLVKEKLPQLRFRATGGFWVDDLAGVDVLIPTMCPISREVLVGADRLQLIQQCGSGLEGVDIAAAAEKDIFVANVPTATSGNADSVAEIGIYLMIGLHRDVRQMARSMQTRKMGQPQGQALGGKTVGIVGLGGIGRALIQRLKGFGVRIIGIKRSDPQAAQTDLGLDWVGAAEQLPELLVQSDVVFLCLPVTPASTGLMNRESLALMKPGAYLINLSRGGLVERDALEWALAGGTLAGAGLDVFWEEPPDPDDPIFRLNVLATPHIGGSTDRSMQGIVAGVVENIRRLQAGQVPLNCASPKPSRKISPNGRF